MYEVQRQIQVAGGTASAYNNNVTTYVDNDSGLTHAAYASHMTIARISWDSRLEGFTNDTLIVRHPELNQQLPVTQVKYVTVRCRAQPLLAVCTVEGAAIYEASGNRQPISWQASRANRLVHYTRGIAVVNNYICFGCSSGDILIAEVTSSVVKVKPKISEHKEGIETLCNNSKGTRLMSIDTDGVAILFDEKLAIVLRISTKQSPTVACIVRHWAVIGDCFGRLHIYQIADGELVATVDAHARAVTAIDVNDNAKLVATASEDSFLRIWKLSTTNHRPIEVDHIFSTSITDAPLTGVCFNNSSRQLSLTAYDYPIIHFVRKKES